VVLFQGLCTTILFLILKIAYHGRLSTRLSNLSSKRRRGLLVRYHRHLIYVHLDVGVGELGSLLRAIKGTTKGLLSGLSAPFLPHHRGPALQLDLELLDPHRLHVVVGNDGGLAAIEGWLPRLRLEGCIGVGKACLAFDTKRASSTLHS
jgi:hypothetical protein